MADVLPEPAPVATEPPGADSEATDVPEVPKGGLAETPAAVVTAGSAEVEPAQAAIELAFTGVGPLHRNFFSQTAPLSALVGALGPCVTDGATVRVTWEDDIRLGHIALEVEPAKLRCAPVMRDGALHLEALEPVGRALAGYRDAIAAAYDYRVASFRAEVRLVRPGEDCLLRLGGDFPPDGSRWHACAEIGGRAVCAPDEEEVGVTVLRPTAAASQPALGACAAP